MEDGVKDGYLEIQDGKFVNFSEEAPKEEWIDFGKDRVIPGMPKRYSPVTVSLQRPSGRKSLAA